MLLMEVRKQLADPRVHSYTPVRRVWAQKPLDTESKTATGSDGAEAGTAAAA